MLKNEMEIIRALSVKLSEDTVFVLTYQYHTEKDPDDPAGRRNLRTKSRYRMLGFVDTVENVEKRIQELHTDAFRLKPWKWPEDPSWEGDILYMKDASNEGQSNWLRLKLRKAVGKEEGLLLMKGYKKDTAYAAETKRKGKKAEVDKLYSVFTPNAVYDVKGYTCSDGSTVDADDFDTLLRKKGQNVWKEIQMKLAGQNPAGDEKDAERGPSLSGPEAKTEVA